MGRFAQVLGIGVRGKIEIELPKREFFSGEFVFGHVKLHVQETIEAEGFSLALHGKEHISWYVKQGKHDHHHHDKHEIFRQTIPLVNGQTVFAPGDHIFPFQFQLPMGLPSSHSIYRRYVSSALDTLKRVMSCILYKLKANVKVKGMLTANIGGELTIGVHGFPPPPPQPIVPVEDKTQRQVYYLCCFDQGPCHVSSAMSTNAVDVCSGVVAVQVAVRNESKRPLTGIFVRLHQELVIHIPKGIQRSDAEIVHEQKFNGIAAGASTELSAQLSIPQIAAARLSKGQPSDPFGDLRMIQQPHQQLPLLSTRDALYASIRYYVSVECAIAYTPDISVELPLTIFLPPPVPVVMGNQAMNPDTSQQQWTSEQ